MVALTLLVITPTGQGLSLPPYSARGITQSLDPVQGTRNASPQIHRTIDGGLIDLTYDQFRKYASTITCTDQQVPAIDKAWQGMIVDVQCACELAYLTVGGTPQRPEVSGSSREEGDYTFYRPHLTMMIMDIKTSLQEWRAAVQWTVELLEV